MLDIIIIIIAISNLLLMFSIAILLLLLCNRVRNCNFSFTVLLKNHNTSQFINQTESSKSPKYNDTKCEIELPPEIIAPNLSKPPRPTGGFGTKSRNAK